MTLQPDPCAGCDGVRAFLVLHGNSIPVNGEVQRAKPQHRTSDASKIEGYQQESAKLVLSFILIPLFFPLQLLGESPDQFLRHPPGGSVGAKGYTLL